MKRKWWIFWNKRQLWGHCSWVQWCEVFSQKNNTSAWKHLQYTHTHTHTQANIILSFNFSRSTPTCSECHLLEANVLGKNICKDRCKCFIRLTFSMCIHVFSCPFNTDDHYSLILTINVLSLFQTKQKCKNILICIQKIPKLKKKFENSNELYTSWIITA